ncbi:MAG: recombinase RecA [Deltaproteobacteria bacterium]|nr:recombinase RecA [Deltaproteobacteria bacterium]
MSQKQPRHNEDQPRSKRGDDDSLDQALKEAMRAIEKQFGKGAIMAMDANAISDIPAISTGSLGLDICLGIGGLPRGRVCEVFGPESSGKTTLALSAIAQAQTSGLRCAFIDAEHALDLRYAANLGIKIDELLVSQPDSGEQALEIVEILARSGAVALIVVDSVAALVPRAEIEGNMGDTHVGLQARLMSQAMRKLASVTAKNAATIFFINQIRMKVGVMFGSPETTPGGNALRFYSSVRLDVRRISQIKSPDGATGYRTRVKVVKNKVAPPFRQAEFDLMFGKGINRFGELTDWASELNILDHSGSWYRWQDRKLGQGRNNVCQILSQEPDLAKSIEEAIRKKIQGDREQAAEKKLVA